MSSKGKTRRYQAYVEDSSDDDDVVLPGLSPSPIEVQRPIKKMKPASSKQFLDHLHTTARAHNPFVPSAARSRRDNIEVLWDWPLMDLDDGPDDDRPDKSRSIYVEDSIKRTTTDDEDSNQLPSPAAKRIKLDSNKSTKDMPANQFAKLFQGPTVNIFVGPEKQAFTLPKALLCHLSTYFDRAFNGPYEEGIKQELQLDGTSVQIFELIVQFCYTGSFTLSDDEEASQAGEASTTYLNFMKECDKYDLHGTESIIPQFKTVLQQRTKELRWPTLSELKIAMDLPRGHEARKLVVAACVRPYALYMTKWLSWKGRPGLPFEFESLIEESDEFAGELLRGYSKAARGAIGAHSILDPLTNSSYQITIE